MSQRGTEDTCPEQVERDIGHDKGYGGGLGENIGNWMHGLPSAGGALTNHNPVAKDEVTRIPETTRTYLFALVRAYTLDWTWLSDIARRVSGANHLTSS